MPLARQIETAPATTLTDSALDFYGAPESPRRKRLYKLAGLVCGGELRIAEAGVRIAWERYRRAQDRARSPHRSTFDVTPESARTVVRSRIAMLRGLERAIEQRWGGF
jgi:hypothetical protein